MKSILLAGLLTCLLTLTVFGQTTSGTHGALSGIVTDPGGATVAGATVTLKNNATGAQRSATTGSLGEFVFALMDPGTYTVTVEAKNFKKAVAPNIAIDVARQSAISVPLEIGAISETVTVTATQEMINSNSPTLSTTIDPRQIRDLPLPSRDPLDLVFLQNGVAPVGDNRRGSSVSGLRQSATNVKQDGINAMDNFVKTSSFFDISAPSLNSTDEFTISTGTNSSDSGFGVAQVNIRTTSGSNTLHGSAFYLIRNNVLEANDFFNNLNGVTRPTEHQHFFGFSLGGPVVVPRFGEGGNKHFWKGRDKAFWFFSYEGFREPFQRTLNRTVLTDVARTGIFRYVGTDGVSRSVDLKTVGNFPALNPVTQAQLNAMPLPNNTLRGDGLNTAGASFNLSGSDPNDKFVMRYDHQLIQKSRVGSHKLEFVVNKATFSLFPDTFNDIVAPFLTGGVQAGQASTRWLMTAADHSTFGKNVTNEFRWGRQWAPVAFLRGASATNPFFINFATGVGGNGFIPGTGLDNTFLDQGRNTTVSSLQDNLSWLKGSHNLRFGGDFEYLSAVSFNDAGIIRSITLGTNGSNQNGLLIGQFPAASTATFNRAVNLYNDLMGVLGSASQTFNVTGPTSGFVPGATRLRIFKERDLAIYGEDQWKVRRNLTLNYGVRWEFLGVPTIPNGLAIQVTNVNDLFGVSGPGNLFNPNAPAGAAPAKATLDFVSGRTGKPIYNNQWKNFAPYFGFAYSPDFKSGFLHRLFGSQGTSSFRGGYSWGYLHDGFTVLSNALGVGTTNPGLIQTAANTTPTGVLTGAGIPLTTPTFAIPITDRANNLINPNNGLWAINPNLRVPYVQQWSFGYEREIAKNTAIEVRYVGNHAIRVLRAVDFNEVNIFENGFLQEFLNAQKNLTLNGGGTFADPAHGGVAGTIPLPILTKFFTGFANTSGSAWASSGFISNLINNNVGSMGSTLAFSNAYRANRENTALGIPANFFVANPNAAFIRLLDNNSMSNYHALQIEFRRRLSKGLQFQADYTFSKALTDARDAFGNNQSDLVSFRTLRNTRLDRARSNFDQTHRFVANAIYELPFGSGRRFLSSAHGVVNQLLEGWSIAPIVAWQSGQPWYVVSGRNTFNSSNPANNPAQLVGISFADFKNNIGVFRTPVGVFFINPALLDIKTDSVTGKLVSSQLKPGLMAAPAPGTFGNFPINALGRPRYFNVDVSIVKRWSVTERFKVSLKTTMIKALNNPNFNFGNQTFDSTTFGLISSTLAPSGESGHARIIHFTLTGTW